MTDSNEYETTEEDFERFKSEVEYWVDVFGLYEFEINYEHKHESGGDYRAACRACNESKMGTLILEKKWDEEPYDGEIEKVAFHEFVELFLSPLWVLGRERYTTEGEMNAARHGIVKRFENVIWQNDYDDREVEE